MQLDRATLLPLRKRVNRQRLAMPARRPHGPEATTEPGSSCSSC